MRKSGKSYFYGIAVALAMVAMASCNTIDSDRIPSMPVNINLTPQSAWHTYGVTAFGDYRYFIREAREPSNFPWLEATRTGFGGVLLIRGVDAFTNEADVPLAYDLACPVERRADVRVRMVPTDALPVAQCPECGSRYNVIEAGGRPISGPALNDGFGLRIYQCLEPASNIGGYLITNR